MASLTTEGVGITIKIRGVHKGKMIIESTTTLGDLKRMIRAEINDDEINLKLFIKGKIFDSSDTDITLATTAGVKKGTIVKAIQGTGVAAQRQAASLSSVPGEKKDPGPRQRCKGGCGFWGAVETDWYCSSCNRARSGVEQPPHWEYNDGGWTKFPAQVSQQLEAARLAKKQDIHMYGSSGHPQRLDLRKLTTTTTRGPRQGRSQALRRVPPTHPDTWLTEKEWNVQQEKDVEKKKTEDVKVLEEAKKQKRLERLKSMTQCCFLGCKKKLKLSDTPCRCELRFCKLHRLPEKHECTFDFKKRANENLSDRLGSGGGQFDQLRTDSRDRI